MSEDRSVIDVEQHVSAVRRQVGTRELEAGQARVVTISRTYDADVEDVWDACTNPERIPRWFLPVSGELRVGGRYQLEGNAGGRVERCDPPKGFAATWEFGGEVSWIELSLAAAPGGGTRFVLEHVWAVTEGSLAGPSNSADQRWAEFGPGAVGIGWELGLLGLAMHLAGAAAVDPAAFQAWSASAEGVEFMTRSGRAWGEADLASGTDPDVARGAAERTVAAYTAPPEPPAS